MFMAAAPIEALADAGALGGLRDRDVTVELTATERVGLHRYRFGPHTRSHLMVDLRHGMQDKPGVPTRVPWAELEVVGDDTLLGGLGDDSMSDTGSTDSLVGGEGNDTLCGEGTLTGNDGDDSIHGSSQPDSIDGGAGNDTVEGGGGCAVGSRSKARGELALVGLGLLATCSARRRRARQLRT